jgi:hypothetical protein
VALLELPPPDFAAFLDEGSAEAPATAEALRDRVIGGLFAYWRSLRPEAGFPARADLDAVELGRLLPHLALVDVIRDPPPFRLRFRICGETAGAILGGDGTGKPFEAVFAPATLGAIRSEVELILTSGRSSLIERSLVKAGGARLGYRRIALPLAADHVRVDGLLLGFARLPEAPAA